MPLRPLRLFLAAALPLAACSPDVDEAARPDDPAPVDEAARPDEPAPAPAAAPAADPRSHFEAFPGQSGPVETRRIETPDGVREVQVAIVDGLAVMEGDMIVGSGDPHQRSNVELAFGLRWPDGVVPYYIDPAMPNQGRVTQAIAAWQRTTRLRFVPRGTQSDYIHIFAGSGCWSPVGKQSGRQYLSLGNNCDLRGAIHELGHALGLQHEQSRSDRGSYLLYTEGNVQTAPVDQRFNFNFSGQAYGPFDFDSIMLYGSSAFSVDTANGDLTTTRPTLTRLDGSRYTVNGSTISAGDVAAIRLLYGNYGDDLSGDHNADLIWRHTNGTLEVDAMSGVNLRYTVPFGSVPSEWKLVGSGDFDADDIVDLLWRNTSTGDNGAWLMSPNGLPGVKSWAPLGNVGPQSGWNVEKTADIDGDGDTDIIWRNVWSGNVSIWTIENGAFLTYHEYGAGLDWSLVGVADFDANGTADLVWRNTGYPWFGVPGTGDVAMWQIDKNGVLANGAIFWSAVPLEWQIAGTGDFNKDGYPDLLWRNTVSGAVTQWFMVGRTAISMPWVSNGVGLDWQIRQVADLDGDGDADVIWRNVNSGSVSLWRMEGSSVAQWKEPMNRGWDWDLIVSH